MKFKVQTSWKFYLKFPRWVGHKLYLGSSFNKGPKSNLQSGLPKRPWFKHFIYAPGFYTGYGVKTLPGIREAIEQREFDQVDQQIRNTAEVLNTFSGEIEKMLGK